jgi:hypothetical protein
VGWLLASSGTAGAHPHSYVDQQALLASSLDAMTVTIRIVPSLVEEMSAGLGMIEIAATASFTLARASDHRVTFEISYDELSHDWRLHRATRRQGSDEGSSTISRRALIPMGPASRCTPPAGQRTSISSTWSASPRPK